MLVITAQGHVLLIPDRGGEPRLLDRIRNGLGGWTVSSRWVAVSHLRDEEEGSLIIWDLDTGERRRLDSPAGTAFHLAFRPDDSLVFADRSGIHIGRLTDPSYRTVSHRPGLFDLSVDGRFLVASNQGDNDEAAVYDLELGTRLQLDRHGTAHDVAIDPAGRLVATLGEGKDVRVGLATGETPHLLIGMKSARTSSGIHDAYRMLDFSPDGRWLASTDGDVVLWPVPDVSQPPLHALPHDELLSKLRSLTNLRVVKDAESDTGWSIESEPFPGWEEIPTW
jgi:WD40 repeat protein